MSVANYIKKLLTIEEYTFSMVELLWEMDKGKTAILRELARLIKNKQVFNLRQNFNTRLTPRYSNFGKLPINLYIHKLFAFIERSYYLSFYSGASHQQFQRDYVMTQWMSRSK